MDQLDFLRHAVNALDALQVKYYLVGSYGCLAYGESRYTQDIDIVAKFDNKHVAGLLEAFPAPEYYRSEEAIRDAIRTQFQFNIIHPASANKIDFILPRSDAMSSVCMNRRRPIALLPDREVFVAAPEDVILGKLWYHSLGGGDRHLRDIAGILRVTGDGVDRDEVERWARQLGYLEAWKAIIVDTDGPTRPPGPGVP